MNPTNVVREGAKARIFRVLAETDKTRVDDDTFIERLVDAGIQITVSMPPPLVSGDALCAVQEALKYDERVWRAFLTLKTIHREQFLERLYQSTHAQLAARVDQLERDLIDMTSARDEACRVLHDIGSHDDEYGYTVDDAARLGKVGQS